MSEPQGGSEPCPANSGKIVMPSIPNLDAQAAHAAARRRLVLLGLAAVPSLAVMRPVKTLAKAKKSCSFSGWHSFKVNANSSAAPKHSKCTAGHKASYFSSKYIKLIPKKKSQYGHSPYYTIYQLPNYLNHSITLTQSTKFSDLFGTGDTKTLAQCLSGGTTNEQGYLTALFNAYYRHSSGYPFTYQQIYDYWAHPTHMNGAQTQTDCATFFKQLDSF